MQIDHDNKQSNSLTENHQQYATYDSRKLFTDESDFTRDSLFHFHNFHHWSNRNQHLSRTTSYQHRFHFNVWAGIVESSLVGPHIFHGT